MSDRGTDVQLTREVGQLIDALQDLQRELEPGNRERRRLPTPRELLRFTSEVTIPAAILVLETNVRVLKLLQRAIRASTDEPGQRSAARPSASGAVRERAEALSRDTLRQLDGALDELQTTMEGRPTDDEAAALFDEARRLQDEVESQLSGSEEAPGPGRVEREPGPDPVNVDVDAEIESIKDEIDDADDGQRGGSDSERDGSDSGENG